MINLTDLGPVLPCLTDAELEQVDRMAARLETIAAAAAKARVRCLLYHCVHTRLALTTVSVSKWNC